MSPNLGCGHNPTLRLYGPAAQQRLPVRPSRAQRKRAGIREDLRRSPAPRAPGPRLRQGDGRLGEPHIKADEAADAAHGRVKRGREPGSRLHRVALPEAGVVKDVELVVRRRVDHVPRGRDVERAVEQLGRGLLRERLVDADVDGHRVRLGGGAEALDKRRRGLRLREDEGLLCIVRDVV